MIAMTVTTGIAGTIAMIATITGTVTRIHDTATVMEDTTVLIIVITGMIIFTAAIPTAVTSTADITTTLLITGQGPVFTSVLASSVNTHRGPVHLRSGLLLLFISRGAIHRALGFCKPT